MFSFQCARGACALLLQQQRQQLLLLLRRRRWRLASSKRWGKGSRYRCLLLIICVESVSRF